MNNLQQMVLRSLCIFETPGEGGAPEFVNLLQNLSLAPADADQRLLRGTGLIVAGSLDEAAVMEERLGVLRINHVELLLQHIFPRFSSTACLPA
jgi:hypothetical protein